jgi:hypothetical protein
MDPLTVRVVLLGGALIAVGLGTELTLVLTGHAASSLEALALRVATLGIGIASLVLAGKAGVAAAPGQQPPKTMKALLRSLSSRPPPDTSAPPKHN